MTDEDETSRLASLIDRDRLFVRFNHSQVLEDFLLLGLILTVGVCLGLLLSTSLLSLSSSGSLFLVGLSVCCLVGLSEAIFVSVEENDLLFLFNTLGLLGVLRLFVGLLLSNLVLFVLVGLLVEIVELHDHHVGSRTHWVVREDENGLLLGGHALLTSRVT